MIGDILDRNRHDLRIVLNSEERETSIYMICLHVCAIGVS